MLCECCEKREATLPDWRERYDYVTKFRVCQFCVNRTDRSFFAQRDANAARLRRTLEELKPKLQPINNNLLSGLIINKDSQEDNLPAGGDAERRW